MNDPSCHSYFDANDFYTFTELFLVTEYSCTVRLLLSVDTEHESSLSGRLNNIKTPEVVKLFNISEGKIKS